MSKATNIDLSTSAAVMYGTTWEFVHHMPDPSNHAALHAALDEWLTMSSGTGYFYVGNVTALRNDLEEA